MPGVESDDLDVSVERNELTVTAERRWHDDEATVLASERPQGSFTRRVTFGDALDTEQVSARLDNGVLIVTIPVSEKSKQRRVEVQSGASGDQAINTTSTDASSSSES